MERLNMKILEAGEPIKCDKCNCKFIIENGDSIIIQPWQDGLCIFMGYDSFVRCPSCQREIKIDSQYGYPEKKKKPYPPPIEEHQLVILAEQDMRNKNART